MTNRVLAREYLPEGVLTLDLTDKRYIYEISVPTCSYRMGVQRMGYGVLLLDSGKFLSVESIHSHDHSRFTCSSYQIGSFLNPSNAIPLLLSIFLRGIRRVSCCQFVYYFHCASTSFDEMVEFHSIDLSPFFSETKSVENFVK